MTRKKVKLAWIMSDSARKASLKKRRLGLIKKVSELTILCGVNSCLIIYSPDEREPAVWPSPEVARQMVVQFRSLPEMEQLKKMINQETYLKERFTKSHDQVTKCHKKNKEVETDFLMHQIDGGMSLDELNFSEIRALVWMLDERMKMVRKKYEFNQQADPYAPCGSASALPDPFPPPPEGQDETTGLGGGPVDPVPCEEWFMNMVNNEPKYAAGTSSTRNDMGFPYENPFAENTAPDDHLGLPRSYPYGGGSSASADMGMGPPPPPPPPPPNFRVPPPPANMQGMMPQTPFRPYGGVSDMGLPRGSNTTIAGGSNFGTFRSDVVGPGGAMANPFEGHIGTSSSAAGADQYGLPPVGFYGGSSNVGTSANDFAKPGPFDGKNWPNNFSL